MIFVLDLDGTLIDSFARHGLLLEELLQEYAPEFHVRTAEYMDYKRSGHNNYQYLTECLGLPETTARKICHKWVEHIEDPDWLQYDKLYGDALPFLESIKSHGDQIIFLSARQNAASAHAEVRRLGLDQYADEIIFVNQTAQYPTKAAYLGKLLSSSAKSSLFLPVECDIIIIGDTEDEFGAALANQIPPFILSRGFRSSGYLSKVLGITKTFANLTEISRRIYE